MYVFFSLGAFESLFLSIVAIGGAKHLRTTAFKIDKEQEPILSASWCLSLTAPLVCILAPPLHSTY